MPRASSRSSPSASVSSSWAPSISSSALSGSLWSLPCASRSVSERATSRCWAPSCRLRSSRRRSCVPASTIRAREVRSSSTRARSWACRRSFSIARPAAAATEPSRSGLLLQRRVVHDRADAAALELDRRPRASGVVVARQLDRVALGVDPAALVLEPEHELERAVAERVGQPASAACRCPAPRRARSSSSETAPGARDAAADEAEEEDPRDRGEDDQAGRAEHVGEPRDARRVAAQRAGQQHEHDHARPQHGRHRRAAAAPVAARQRRMRMASTTATTATPTIDVRALKMSRSVSLRSISSADSGQPSQPSVVSLGEAPQQLRAAVRGPPAHSPRRAAWRATGARAGRPGYASSMCAKTTK